MLQQHRLNNFKLATELGAEIIKKEGTNIAKTIAEEAEEREVTTICIGKPTFNIFTFILATNTFNELLKKLKSLDIDLVILS